MDCGTRSIKKMMLLSGKPKCRLGITYQTRTVRKSYYSPAALLLQCTAIYKGQLISKTSVTKILNSLNIKTEKTT